MKEFVSAKPGLLICFRDGGVALFVSDNSYLKDGKIKKFWSVAKKTKVLAAIVLIGPDE